MNRKLLRLKEFNDGVGFSATRAENRHAPALISRLSTHHPAASAPARSLSPRLSHTRRESSRPADAQRHREASLLWGRRREAALRCACERATTGRRRWWGWGGAVRSEIIGEIVLEEGVGVCVGARYVDGVCGTGQSGGASGGCAIGQSGRVNVVHVLRRTVPGIHLVGVRLSFAMKLTEAPYKKRMIYCTNEL